jgi:RNA polymerase sigma factor (sigma-70 family)
MKKRTARRRKLTPYPPPLTREEEAECIRSGDLDRLVLANMSFAIQFVERYRSRGLEYADLVQEAALGLVQAARKVEPTYDNKFITYAKWYVLRNVRRAIKREYRSIRRAASDGDCLDTRSANRVALDLETRELIERALDRLDDTQRHLLWMRHAEGRTLTACGKAVGYSREWARQKIKVALADTTITA